MAVYARKLELLRARKLPKLPELNRLDDLLRRTCTSRQIARIKHGAARMVNARRQRNSHPLYRPALNYLINLPRNTNIPEKGGLFGKWLYLHPLEPHHDFGGDTIERTGTLLNGGPLLFLNKDLCSGQPASDTWFCSPQDEFGKRRPCDVIRDDGLPGAIAVGQALDRLNPEGPPLIIKQRTKKR